MDILQDVKNRNRRRKQEEEEKEEEERMGMDKRKLLGGMALLLHQALPRSGTIRTEPVQQADTGPLSLYPFKSPRSWCLLLIC